MNTNNRKQDFIWGAVIGSAVGALTTMLFTTKKGKQIRQDIADKYHDFENGIKGWTEDAKETVETGAKKVTNTIKGESN